jgi:hypothetical protein
LHLLTGVFQHVGGIRGDGFQAFGGEIFLGHESEIAPAEGIFRQGGKVSVIVERVGKLAALGQDAGTHG